MCKKTTKKHETGFEPATLALARRYSTTEPLVHKVCTFKTTHKLSFPISNNSLRSSFRPISNSQLHASLHFHLCPIYLIVSKGSLTLSSMDISS